MQGILGLVSGSPGLLCLHVVLGGLAAAALTAHDAANFALLEFRSRLCRLLKENTRGSHARASMHVANVRMTLCRLGS